MKVIIFEDYSYGQFYPLTLTRPVSLLKCGVVPLAHKIQRLYPLDKCFYLIRDELIPVFNGLNIFHINEVENEECIFISAKLILSQKIELNFNEACVVDDEVVAFKILGNGLKKLKKEYFFEQASLRNFLQSLNVIFRKLDAKKLDYLFDLVSENEIEIKRDFEYLKKNFDTIKKLKSILISGSIDDILVHTSAHIYPGVYFITEKGPIIIDENAVLKPFSIIEGPCYIGKNTLIDGAKIRGNTSIFNTCKIAGEIENSIILDFTNKHHDGFLGHSYIGSFVNFGAMSTNSDLKNNYGEVQICIQNKKINTGSIKVGAFIGDHTKLGIGSLINTGSVIGMGCNLFFEGAMYPKELPSFLWGGKYPFQEYNLLQFIENSQRILKRKNRTLKKEETDLYKQIYNNGKKIRENFLISN